VLTTTTPVLLAVAATVFGRSAVPRSSAEALDDVTGDDAK
jgi:hypothetical protein